MRNVFVLLAFSVLFPLGLRSSSALAATPLGRTAAHARSTGDRRARPPVDGAPAGQTAANLNPVPPMSGTPDSAARELPRVLVLDWPGLAAILLQAGIHAESLTHLPSHYEVDFAPYGLILASARALTWPGLPERLMVANTRGARLCLVGWDDFAPGSGDEPLARLATRLGIYVLALAPPGLRRLRPQPAALWHQANWQRDWDLGPGERVVVEPTEGATAIARWVTGTGGKLRERGPDAAVVAADRTLFVSACLDPDAPLDDVDSKFLVALVRHETTNPVLTDSFGTGTRRASIARGGTVVPGAPGPNSVCERNAPFAGPPETSRALANVGVDALALAPAALPRSDAEAARMAEAAVRGHANALIVPAVEGGNVHFRTELLPGHGLEQFDPLRALAGRGLALIAQVSAADGGPADDPGPLLRIHPDWAAPGSGSRARLDVARPDVQRTLTIWMRELADEPGVAAILVNDASSLPVALRDQLASAAHARSPALPVWMDGLPSGLSPLRRSDVRQPVAGMQFQNRPSSQPYHPQPALYAWVAAADLLPGPLAVQLDNRPSRPFVLAVGIRSPDLALAEEALRQAFPAPAASPLQDRWHAAFVALQRAKPWARQGRARTRWERAFSLLGRAALSREAVDGDHARAEFLKLPREMPTLPDTVRATLATAAQGLDVRVLPKASTNASPG